MVAQQVAAQSASGRTPFNTSGTGSTSALYGVVDTLVAQSGYSPDAGSQFASLASWDLALSQQAFVGGLQDEFGQRANDALAASRAQDQALKQQLGAQFAGQANMSLATQRAEHAAAAVRQNEAGLDFGRGPNDWSDDALAIDLGNRGDSWTERNARAAQVASPGSPLWSSVKSAARWADEPIGMLQNAAQTASRGNALIAEGLDAVGLHGLADIHSAWGRGYRVIPSDAAVGARAERSTAGWQSRADAGERCGDVRADHRRHGGPLPTGFRSSAQHSSRWPSDRISGGLAYRTDLPNHLFGPDGFTKSG